jgi:hypothetical protein
VLDHFNAQVVAIKVKQIEKVDKDPENPAHHINATRKHKEGTTQNKQTSAECSSQKLQISVMVGHFANTQK